MQLLDASYDGHTIQTDFCSVANIEVDEERIRQVLQNLLANAIKFSNKPGCILVKIEDMHSEIKFSVIDHGIGIEHTNLDDLFSPYYTTTHGYTGGLGLGLPLCYKFINLHNGKIFIDSNEGNGTTVTFTLPKNASDVTSL